MGHYKFTKLVLISALSLKCFVGKGNSSLVLPATMEEQEKWEEKQDRRTVFGIYECGTSNSNLRQFDSIIRNVTKQIENFTNKLTGNQDDDKESRRKERQQDGQYACAKVSKN